MASWVRERVQSLKENEDSRQRERAWQLHKAEVFPAKAQRLWERLTNTLENDVREFNEGFQDDKTRQFEFVPHSLEITIRRTYYPVFQLIVRLDITNQSVNFERQSVRNDQCDPQGFTGSFPLYLDDTDALYLTDRAGSLLSAEQVSQTLLAPLFE